MLRNPLTRNLTTTSSSISFTAEDNDNDNDDDFRDIHALTPPPAALPVPLPPSRRSSNLSVASDVTNSSENFTTMSREFNALVIAGSNIDHDNNQQDHNHNNLDRIGEEEGEVGEMDTNPLAIVADMNPLPSPPDHHGGTSYHAGASSSLAHLMGPGPMPGGSTSTSSNNNNNSNNTATGSGGGELAVHRVKKEEVEAKICAWQNAKLSKINNRFKREDSIISGWETEQVHKASSWMKKVERKLEEKRAKAMEKMENEIAKAHRKAEERRASAEGKRGTKVAKVLEVANLMRAVGRPPAKRSFF